MKKEDRSKLVASIKDTGESKSAATRAGFLSDFLSLPKQKRSPSPAAMKRLLEEERAERVSVART